MADQKISELTALTGANVADDDAIAIVDTSATETKKIVFSELKNALDTATGFVRITGDTMTGNLSMGDNVKAIFGAGSDLQIYHDPAAGHSYIKELGAGNLIIDGTNLTIRDSNTAKVAISVQNNTNAPLVQLRYDNAPKLATTSTGIDVTGTVTADGLTVEKSISSVIASASGTVGRFINNANSSDAAIVDIVGGNTSVTSGEAISALYLSDANANGRGRVQYNHQNDNLELYSAAVPRLNIANNGDISFYDSAGSSQSFFWDAADERLGIGTTSPVRPLSVKASQEQLTLSEGDLRGATFDYQSSTGALHISTNGANARTSPQLTLDLNGNVGIGTSSPSTFNQRVTAPHLVVGTGGNAAGLTLYSGTSSQSSINFAVGTTTSQQYDGGFVYVPNSGSPYLSFHVNAGTERMRIDSSGNVGIGDGTLSHTSMLHVYKSLGTADLALQSAGSSGRKYILQSKTDGSLAFYDNNASTERMRIDSSGNVGIGTSTALTGPSAATALRIGNQINIYEYDDSSNPVQMNIDQNIDANENYITTDHAARYQMRDGVHKWFTTGSGTAGTATNIGAGEAMRIDSSGNLLVGQSTTTVPGVGNTTAGVSIRGDDGSFFSRSLGSGDTNSVVTINRSSNDGNILGLAKDGTTVGSIGTSGGDLTVGNDVTTLKFHNGLNTIHPNGTGSGSDGLTTLGWTNNRFKDLYLSGGVYLGGVGAANKLDYYESGTFTYSGSSINLTSLSTSERRYIKIGDQVTLWMKASFDVTAADTRTYIALTLPFNTATNTTVISGGGLIEGPNPFKGISAGGGDSSTSTSTAGYWSFIPITTGTHTGFLNLTYVAA